MKKIASPPNANLVKPVTELTPVAVASGQEQNTEEKSLIPALVSSNILPSYENNERHIIPEPAFLLRRPDVTVKMLFTANLYYGWAAAKGTVIWVGILYIPLKELDLVGYILKNLAMGFFPNYFTKNDFKKGCLACGNSEIKAKRRAKNYVKIVSPLDSFFQIQLDAIRYAETGEFVFFSENVFSRQEMLLHLAFTLMGYSLFFHLLTYFIEPEELNSKESAKIGPQYYTLYAIDSILYLLSTMLMLSDFALDISVAPIVTGLACFFVNFSLDLLQLWHERRQQEQELAEMYGPVIEVIEEGVDIANQNAIETQESEQSKRPGCGDILLGYAKSACCFFNAPPRRSSVVLQELPRLG